MARPATAASGTVRLGFVPVIGSASACVIQGLGWAADAGLNLQLQRFDTHDDAVGALAEGRIDACFAQVFAVLAARPNAPALKIVAAAAVEEFTIVARGGFAREVMRNGAKAAVDAFADSLSRKPRIAIEADGAGHELFVNYWLDRGNGVATDRVSLLIRKRDELEAALLDGSVDAGVMQQPRLADLRAQQPTAESVATARHVMPDYPGTVLAVTAMDQPWLAPLLKLHMRATALLRKPLAPAAVPVWKLLGQAVVPLIVIQRALADAEQHFLVDPARILTPLQTLLDYQGGAQNAVAGVIDGSALKRAGA